MPPGRQTTASAKRQSKGAAQLDGPGGASLEPSGPRSHLDIQQLADLIEPISFDLALPQSLLEPPDGNRNRAVARHPCGTRQLPQFQAACPPFRVQTMPSQPRDSSLHHAETTRRSAQSQGSAMRPALSVSWYPYQLPNVEISARRSRSGLGVVFGTPSVNSGCKATAQSNLK